MRRVCCFAFYVFLCVCSALSPAVSKEVVTLRIGQTAPDFSLPGVDGKDYSLKDFADSEYLVVLFTCNHCPTAQAYEQRVLELYKDYHDRGVAMVAISPNSAEAVRLDELGYSDIGDTLEEMKLRAKELDLPFPYLYDGETQQASTEYGVLATPHIYIFDADRKLQYVGRIDDGEVTPPKSHDARNALDELLAGKKVSVAETRVFGCSTKWADKKQSAVDAVGKWDTETAELTAIKPEALKKTLTGKSEKYRLVNVWATWCVPCVEEMDDLVTIHRMYRKRHFEVITISADDMSAQKKALKTLNEKHCSATNYILDSERRDDLFESVDPEWKGAVPYTALISPEGKVIHRIHGEFDPLELRREIVKHIGRTYADRK